MPLATDSNTAESASDPATAATLERMAQDGTAKMTSGMASANSPNSK